MSSLACLLSSSIHVPIQICMAAGARGLIVCVHNRLLAYCRPYGRLVNTIEYGKQQLLVIPEGFLLASAI